MKKYLFIFSVVSFLVTGFYAHAETINTTGFPPGQIWYSKEPLIAGDTVSIHTAIWNGDSKDISARVEFYDKNIVLGVRDIVIPKAQLKDVFISWKVTSGDHVISAKIVSSTLTTSGKKEPVVISRSSTDEDRKFVPVAIKQVDGVPASSTDVLKNQVSKASSEIQSILPPSVAGNINSFDVFRDSTYKEIKIAKVETQKEIDAKNNPTKATSPETKNAKILDATDTPIAHVKLFFLTILGFIFGTPIIFYGLCAFVVFIILRFLYRKIRNR
jgi:hypothetical protein